MTEHREFKRLVRERAARTGQSYTTARRHLLAESARALPAPAGVVPRYDTFGGGDHHESILLAHLLRQAGHIAPHTGRPYSEAMICGLGGGIGFMYAVFEYRGMPPILTVVAQHHPEPWVPAVLGRLGIGFLEKHSAGAGPAMAHLRALLDAGRAVRCTVAGAGLPWRPTRSTVLSTDPYPVVVAGRRDGEVLVDDGAVTPWVIDEEQFSAAWSAYRKGRHKRIAVDAPVGPVDLESAVRSAVATTVAHLTGPVLGNSYDVNFGFSGMARFAEQLRDARTRAGWAARFAGPGALDFGLRRLYECLELQYTAPAATRPLYADFLDEAAGALGVPSWSEAAKRFRVSGGHWSAVAARAAGACGPYAELIEDRTFLVLTGAAEAEIRAVTDRIESTGAPVPELSGRERAALFAELADLVDAARTAEEDAVRLLVAT